MTILWVNWKRAFYVTVCSFGERKAIIRCYLLLETLKVKGIKSRVCGLQKNRWFTTEWISWKDWYSASFGEKFGKAIRVRGSCENSQVAIHIIKNWRSSKFTLHFPCNQQTELFYLKCIHVWKLCTNKKFSENLYETILCEHV